MVLVWVGVLGLLVAAFVSRPFWDGKPGSAVEDPEVAALEAAREAKYREIKDAEIDHKAGKLNAEDYSKVDGELRREAVLILNQLERAQSREAEDL